MRPYEAAVQALARQAVDEPLIGAVEVKAEFYLHPRGRMPDLDNLLKSLLDGLRGVAFEDDGQVRHILASMKWVKHRDHQRAEVWIRRLCE